MATYGARGCATAVKNPPSCCVATWPERNNQQFLPSTLEATLPEARLAQLICGRRECYSAIPLAKTVQRALKLQLEKNRCTAAVAVLSLHSNKTVTFSVDLAVLTLGPGVVWFLGVQLR